jgi:hypothetical protein
MDYKKVYENMIEMCKKTSPYDRMFSRNKEDSRLLNDIYTENHHITPKKLGGSDDKDNIIEVLPEEHLFLHQLRYKLFGERVDMLAVRFMLNGFVNKSHLSETVKKPLSKSILKGYGWIKQQSSNFREKHGWQTTEGRNRISESRKGKMPVVDVYTGEIIGSVYINHPKVLAGEWVHHSKGNITVIENLSGDYVKIKTDEYYKNKHLYTYIYNQSGEHNGNYSGITDEEIVEYAIKKSLEYNRIISYSQLIYMARNDGYNFPKSLSKMRFNGNGRKEYTRIIEENTGMIYDKYYRSEENKRKISETLKRKSND